MKLRPYQKKTIDDLYSWMYSNNGNPCIVLPTGAGKSVIIAKLCEDAIKSYPRTRILMLTHVKELILQNYQKLISIWGNAPAGIYSAGLNKRDIEQITFASIQSIGKKHDLIGHVDIVLIDECHLVNHKDEGFYRQLINNLLSINPHLRVIGLTATPYRLGHGLITDKPAIFDDLIEPVTIEELQIAGYLAKLKSKITIERFDLTGVHKRGGDYIESELQKAIDKNDKNLKIVKEIIQFAENRKSWLLFCAGVNHAEHIKTVLNEQGITAECITGKTSDIDRDRIINEFKQGKIKALTNCDVLTTGFDYPDIDLIAFLRPTTSVGLYIQMAGRGLRLKSHTDHCLILDFAGLVSMHGAITDVLTPNKASEGEGVPPMKECPKCMEIQHAAKRLCVNCGFIFPIESKEDELYLRNDDIMGLEPTDMNVTFWRWELFFSKKSQKELLKVTYYGEIGEKSIFEFFCINHDGYAGLKARKVLSEMGITQYDVDYLQKAKMPKTITYKKENTFYKIIRRFYERDMVCEAV